MSKWFRDLAISRIIVETTEGLDIRVPEPTVDLPAIRQRYHEATERADGTKAGEMRTK